MYTDNSGDYHQVPRVLYSTTLALISFPYTIANQVPLVLYCTTLALTSFPYTAANPRARGEGRYVPVRAGSRIRPCGAARDRDVHAVWPQEVSYSPHGREVANEYNDHGLTDQMPIVIKGGVSSKRQGRTAELYHSICFIS